MNEYKEYICHCNVSANDGNGHIHAKPTIYVVGFTLNDAIYEAKRKLEETYQKLGCTYVDVTVVHIKEI